MAVTDIRVAPLSPVNFVARIVERATAAFASWNEMRVTRAALSQLSDRELDDIGLCRGDINFVTRNY